MLVKDLPKKDLEALQKVFKEEVKADLLCCWGGYKLKDMHHTFQQEIGARDPRTKKVLAGLFNKYGVKHG